MARERHAAAHSPHSDHLAPVWVISISPFITFIIAVMKRCACLHKALTGFCLFNTFLSHWQASTNLIYPWVTVANIRTACLTPNPIWLLLWSLTYLISHQEHIACMSVGTYSCTHIPTANDTFFIVFSLPISLLILFQFCLFALNRSSAVLLISQPQTAAPWDSVP